MKEKALAGANTSAFAWLVGLAAWAVPGAGHVLQGRWLRGLLLAGAVCIMFFMGMAFGGHLFNLSGGEGGLSGLLQIFPAIANLGSGLLYLLCWVTNTGFAEHAERATFEYGNTFLLVAGLLNYLAMLDAFDIAVGRKP